MNDTAVYAGMDVHKETFHSAAPTKKRKINTIKQYPRIIAKLPITLKPRDIITEMKLIDKETLQEYLLTYSDLLEKTARFSFHLTIIKK